MSRVAEAQGHGATSQGEWTVLENASPFLATSRRLRMVRLLIGNKLAVLWLGCNHAGIESCHGYPVPDEEDEEWDEEWDEEEWDESWDEECRSMK